MKYGNGNGEGKRRRDGNGEESTRRKRGRPSLPSGEGGVAVNISAQTREFFREFHKITGAKSMKKSVERYLPRISPQELVEITRRGNFKTEGQMMAWAFDALTTPGLDKLTEALGFSPHEPSKTVDWLIRKALAAFTSVNSNSSSASQNSASGSEALQNPFPKRK